MQARGKSRNQEAPPRAGLFVVDMASIRALYLSHTKQRIGVNDMQTLATLYINGAIRNAAGKLIGFYDAEAGTVVVDGQTQVFSVVDGEHAMDVVAHYAR